MSTPKRISDIVCSNGIISFECTSEMYGTTDAAGKAAIVLKNGFVALGDGCDYVLNEEDKAEIKKQLSKTTINREKNMKYFGLVKDQMKVMETRRTKSYKSYEAAHKAAETLCKRTMGNRGVIDVEVVDK